MRKLAVSVLVTAAMVCDPLAAVDDVGPEDDSPYYDEDQSEMEDVPDYRSESLGTEGREDVSNDLGQAPDYAMEEEDGGIDAAADAAYYDDWTEDSEAVQESGAAADPERVQREPETTDLGIAPDLRTGTEGSNRSTSQRPNTGSGAPFSSDTADAGSGVPETLSERVGAITRVLDAELAAMAGKDALATAQPRLGEINQRLNQAIDWVNQAAERGMVKEARDAIAPLVAGCQRWKPRLESALGASNLASQNSELRAAIDHCHHVIEASKKLPN